ncbi:MAG: hypothetical protein Fur0037_16880 [Planctomycetota bacterium]
MPEASARDAELEERAWNSILGCLDADPEDLAFAEAAMADASPGSEEALSPELIERIVARATGAGRTEVAAAPARVHAFPRFRRAAAAAAAALGFSKLGAAAVLLGLTAATAFWIGHHSATTMSYETAVRILVAGEARLDETAAALSSVVMRVRHAAGLLREIEEDPSSPPELARAARSGLAELRARAETALRPLPVSVEGSIDIDRAIGLARDPRQGAPERLYFLGVAVTLAANGLSAVQAMPDRDLSSGKSKKRILLERLRREISP